MSGVFSETVNFDWHTEFDNQDVKVAVEWNEKWFGRKSSFVYDHDIARLACWFSVAAYSRPTEKISDNTLVKNYMSLGVSQKDIELHYDMDYKDSIWGNDQCAFSIASKEIESSKGRQTLVFVVIRGTPLNSHEWISNLNISDTSHTEEIIHTGFGRATTVIHSALISYLLRHKIDPTDSFLMVTGHSRGAATSNLLAAMIEKDNFFKTENCYVYTYAAPNVTTSKSARDKKYGFIWNIVNAEDIVPTVPLYRDEWKFTKFGNCRALINYTNSPQEEYENKWVPLISRTYSTLNGKDYHPFRTGPFVPAVFTRVFSHFVHNVDNYYSGANVHDRGEDLMNRLFAPKDSDDGQKTDGKKNSRMVEVMNKKTGGLVDYVSRAMGDMHSKETYLAYMLSMEESEVFSQMGYTIVEIRGAEEACIVNDQGEMLLRIIDGRFKLSEEKIPVAAMPLTKGQILIGVPSNMDLKILMTDETVISSPISVKLEHFDACGVYLGSSDPEKIYIRKGNVHCFGIGKNILDSDKIDRKKLSPDESKKIIDEYNLTTSSSFSVSPEISFSQDLDLRLGVCFGVPKVYGSAFVSQGLSRVGDCFNFGAGIGQQVTLYRTIYFDVELISKFSAISADTVSGDSFCFVPEIRTSFSFKGIGKSKIFAAVTWDFCVDGMNEGAFDSRARNSSLNGFELSDSVKIYPSISGGVRF